MMGEKGKKIIAYIVLRKYQAGRMQSRAMGVVSIFKTNIT